MILWGYLGATSEGGAAGGAHGRARPPRPPAAPLPRVRRPLTEHPKNTIPSKAKDFTCQLHVKLVSIVPETLHNVDARHDFR